MATTLDRKLLSLAPGSVPLELFDVDLRPIGGSEILRVTPNRGLSVPDRVLRIRDTSTGSRQSHPVVTVQPVPGQRFSFEFFYRMSEGATYPAVLISNSVSNGQAAGYARFRLNPSTLATFAAVGSYVTGASVAQAVAGAFIYVRITGVWASGATVPLFFHVAPAIGLLSAWGSESNAGLGAIDVANATLTVMEGGSPLRQPTALEVGAFEAVNVTVEAPPPDPDNLMAWVPVWGGNAYTPIPFEASGFERSGSGPFPRPKVRMSNLFNEGSALAQEYMDLMGAVVTRRRVYPENLDNGAFPDPLAQMAPDVFIVDRKSMQNGTVIEWELASALDQQGVMLPGRQILRDVCPWSYRVWDGTKFVYAAENGCPYTGTDYFNDKGQSVASPELDKCSHQLNSGCRRRYGTKADLPFGGFPMVGRLG